MYRFSHAKKFLLTGYRIQHKDWKQDYYIYQKDNVIHDSMGNLFYPNAQEFYQANEVVYEAAGDVWELYLEIDDRNL